MDPAQPSSNAVGDIPVSAAHPRTSSVPTIANLTEQPRSVGPHDATPFGSAPVIKTDTSSHTEAVEKTSLVTASPVHAPKSPLRSGSTKSHLQADTVSAKAPSPAPYMKPTTPSPVTSVPSSTVEAIQVSQPQPIAQVPFPTQPQPALHAPPTSAPAAPAQPPVDPSKQQPRRLNVRDALFYLDAVKSNFQGQPEIYNRFLDIMKDFKSGGIDTPGVIDRVTNLFRGKQKLINGFSAFLPLGYSLESSENPSDPIKVLTPTQPEGYLIYPPGTSSGPSSAVNTAFPLPGATPTRPSTEPAPSPQPIPSQSAPLAPPPMSQGALPTGNPADKGEGRRSATTAEFNHAINFVNKIKNRFATEPEVYKQFLEILQLYQRDHRPISEIYAQVTLLFKESPDLIDEFKYFLPDRSPMRKRGPPPAGSEMGASKLSESHTAPSELKRHAPASSSAAQQPKKKPKTTSQASKQEKQARSEELEFFDKVKRAIRSPPAYNEFVKILNMFAMEVIDTRTLIQRVTPFLDKSPELLDWFKKFVRYEEEPGEQESQVVWNMPAERPQVDLKQCKASGHSYRLLPKSIPRSESSNRDALCREVLNDDWISHPVYLSETGFTAHKKNIYEEALFKCEEERYEFDRHIEANLHTIALLEPINKRLQLMHPEDRSQMKLPIGLGGFSKTIYQRAIKKIYDKERGQEMLDALHNTPAMAVPIILRRLKQKDEEWKRARREWNKVWRDIDGRNYAKALDHQGISFKALDRKTMVPKNLCAEIEQLYREQRNRRSENLTVRYQLDFAFKEAQVFKDCNRVLLHAMASTASISQTDEDRIREDLIFTFLQKFFFVEYEWEPHEYAFLSDEEGGEPSIGLGITTSTNKEAKFAYPTERTVYSFYANSNLYVLLRLYQMLYARLFKMKEMSVELSQMPTRHEKVNTIAVELGLVKAEQTEPKFNEKDRYSDLLKHVDAFVEGKMDASEFEDKCRMMYTTSAYLVYTVDKLSQALVKQLQVVLSDARSMEMIQLYYSDRIKSNSSPRQEAMYRLAAESHVDDSLYRMELFMPEGIMTIQLIGREEQVSDDTITAEDKWSLYVDHFVQLSTTEGIRLKRRDPFLKRNLPSTIPDDPPSNVETQSGLELKICLNTYRIFFVDNTEDYFHRRTGSLCDQWTVDRTRRERVFRNWIDSESGWKRELATEPAQEMQQVLDDWLRESMNVSTGDDDRQRYTFKTVAHRDEQMDVDQS